MARSHNLRKHRKTDLERLHQIDQVCFPAGIAYSKAELRYYIDHPTAFTVVIEDETASITGFCIGHTYIRRNIPHGHIITIDVVPEARRQRLGSALLESVEGHFRSAGAQSISLEVAVDNLEAQKFYEQMGYEASGRIPDYYLNSIDALIMTKRLTTRPGLL